MNGSNENISEKFFGFLKSRNLLQGKFLAAVSGGIDSVVLCEVCRQSGIQFAIAHCNFQLRGEESDRDEKFVKDLGEKFGVKVFVKRFDTNGYANENKISIQEAARELRYNWFLQVKNENKFSFTLLAHHADDNMETLLLNFFRGTGLQGLTAIPEENPDEKFILRPLLEVRRKEILDFAEQHQLNWVEDSSNTSSKYARNFFRNEILPAIKKVYPQADKNLLNNIHRFREINALYEVAVNDLKKKVCKPFASEVRIPVLQIMKYRHTSLIYEIIKDYGFGEKQLEEVMKLIDADSGKFIQNDRYQIIKHRNWLIVAPNSTIADTIAIEEGMKTVCFSGGKLELETIPNEKFSLRKKENIAQLDTRHVEFPLLLRKWNQGDYFYPLGMSKKKKLARFFIDRKLPRNQKENTWVLESNKKIIWVVGMRIDDRFKVVDSTKQVLIITYQNKIST